MAQKEIVRYGQQKEDMQQIKILNKSNMGPTQETTVVQVQPENTWSWDDRNWDNIDFHSEN